MKSLIIFIFLLFLNLTVKADNYFSNLVVLSKDGTAVAYALEEKPKLAFTKTDLLITTDKTTVTYPLSNLAKFTFDKQNNTAIKNLLSEEPIFSFDGDVLIFPNLKTNSEVSILTIGGMLVLKKKVLSDGEYSFPLSRLSTGIYIVKIDKLTYKIIKK